MDRTIDFYLLTAVQYQDNIGQFKETTRRRRVFGQLNSVSASEFFAGGQNGLKPEFRITMFGPDYAGEKTLAFMGEVYTIYRVYYAKNDMVELYVEKRSK